MCLMYITRNVILLDEFSLIDIVLNYRKDMISIESFLTVAFLHKHLDGLIM